MGCVAKVDVQGWPVGGEKVAKQSVPGRVHAMLRAWVEWWVAMARGAVEW